MFREARELWVPVIYDAIHDFCIVGLFYLGLLGVIVGLSHAFGRNAQ